MAGESFSREITRRDGKPWGDTATATYKMVDLSGTVIATGTLEKSSDGKMFSLLIGKSVTENLEGEYRVYVFLQDTANPEINELIAQHAITYKGL